MVHPALSKYIFFTKPGGGTCPGNILMHDIHLVESELLVDGSHGACQILDQVYGVEAGSEDIFIFFRVVLDLFSPNRVTWRWFPVEGLCPWR